MIRRLLVIGLLVYLLGGSTPAWAAVHLYQEQPGQVTLRSQQSLQDQAQRSWQTIVFKRYINDQLEGIFLRLVGFPGQVEVAPGQPVQFSIADQFLWQSQPAMDASTVMLPNNVGQYDVQPLLKNLDNDTRLVLEIPLVNGLSATLIAPPTVIHEWREVTQFSPQN